MRSYPYISFTIVIVFVLLFVSVRLLRRPSYSIQTDGKLYIVNKLSKSITVFDLFLGEELFDFSLDVEPHEAVGIENGDRVVVTNYGSSGFAGNTISVIDAKTSTLEKEIELNSLRPHGIVAFPNSSKVGVVTDIGNELVVVDIKTNRIEKKISTQQVLSHLIAIHPNTLFAYVTNINSGSLSVIDLVKDKVIKIIPCGNGSEGIDISPDGMEVWITNSKEDSIIVISTETLKITDTLKTGKEPLRIKFSIDGSLCVVTNSSDGTVSVYDTFLKKQVKIIRIPGKENIIERLRYHTPRPVGIMMHPNGLYAFIANSNADKIEVIDMNTLTLVSSIGTGRVPDGIAFVE